MATWLSASAGKICTKEHCCDLGGDVLPGQKQYVFFAVIVRLGEAAAGFIAVVAGDIEFGGYRSKRQ